MRKLLEITEIPFYLIPFSSCLLTVCFSKKETRSHSNYLCRKKINSLNIEKAERDLRNFHLNKIKFYHQKKHRLKCSCDEEEKGTISLF